MNKRRVTGLRGGTWLHCATINDGNKLYSFQELKVYSYLIPILFIKLERKLIHFITLENMIGTLHHDDLQFPI